MTTTTELIARARGYLMSSRRDNQNILAADWVNTPVLGITTLAFAYPIDGLASGAYISLGLDVFQVFDVNAALKTVNVARVDTATDVGAAGSTHVAGDIALINPEFSALALWREMNTTISSLSSPSNGVFAYTDQTFTYNPAQQSYELDPNSQGIIDVLEVRYDVPGPSQTWPILPRNKYAVKRDADLTEFPSGIALTLYGGGYPGRGVTVVFSVPLPALGFGPGTSNVDPNHEDLVCLGAAARLAGLQEIKRNLTGAQSDTRRAAEVPAGAMLAASRWLEQEFRRRVLEEKERLQKQFPTRRRTR